MPRIRPYESQVSPTGGIPASGADLSAVGGTGAEQLGQGIVQAGYSAAHAYQILQAQEDSRAISETHVAYAKLQNAATQQMVQAQANADVNDKDFFGTVYRGGTPEGENPAEGSIQDQINKLDAQVTNPVAKNVSRQLAASLTTNILNQSLNFQTHLAGEYAKSQVTTMTDQLQNTVNADPSQYPVAMGKITDFLKTPLFYGPHMNEAVRDNMKRQMVNQVTGSMVRGMLNNPQNGSLVLNRLDRGDWSEALTGEQHVALRSQAKTTVQGMEVEARRAEMEMRQRQHDEMERTASTLTSQFLLHVDNPKAPPLTATQVAKANITDGDKRALFGLIDTHASQRALHSDEHLSSDLLESMHLPPGDPRRMLTERPLIEAATSQNGQLPRITFERYKQLRSEFESSRTEDGRRLGQSRDAVLNGFKSSVTEANPLLAKLDQAGDVNWGRLQAFAMSEEARLQRENKDPHDLYNEKSAEYIGHKLQPFVKDWRQSLKTIQEKLKGETAPKAVLSPRLPGETPEQYDKRIGK